MRDGKMARKNLYANEEARVVTAPLRIPFTKKTITSNNGSFSKPGKYMPFKNIEKLLKYALFVT
jgi:hypothetical protein